MEIINDGPDVATPSSSAPDDNPPPFSARKLVFAKIIDNDGDSIVEVKNSEPPDKTNLRTRYKLQLRAMRLSRNSHTPIEKDTTPWDFDGRDWVTAADGNWTTPPPETGESPILSQAESYQSYAAQTNVVFNKCTAPSSSHPSQPDHYLKIQSDHGANANITSNLAALENVQWIEPTSVESADKASSLKVTAIGELPILASDGNVYKLNCFYSANADGTLLSPNAFSRQFSAAYYGYHIYSDMDMGTGDIVFLGREDIDDLVFTTVKENDLWFHTADIHPLCKPLHLDNATASYCTSNAQDAASDFASDIRVNRLSNAAKWELWHQRLGHVGASVLEELHKHADGVPKLHGNAFYKCPSCMSGKLCTKQPSKKKGNLGTTVDAPPTPDNPLDSEEDLDAWLDAIHLPDAQPGQHFHADFGFVRGSEFSLKLENGKTITSIDGKNSYLLIADRKTRFLWIYVSDSKEPPVNEVKLILDKFGCANPHRTIRTDQDKALGKSALFHKMVENAGFLVELTGTDNSKANTRAERPHRDLSQSMRCMLHSSGLGPEYWSHALTHAVYIKNRIPHRSLNMSPFQAFTGRKPDLSNLRIFGSRVYARKPGKRPAKLDHNTSNGIFLSHTATTGNVNFIDDKTSLIKMGTHVLFDEAHMTVPANKAPLAAQALQRLGYYARETWIDDAVKQEHSADINNQLLIERLTATATPPSRSTDESIGLDLHSDMDDTILEPGAVKVVLTGIAAKSPSGSYLRVAPRSGLTIKSHLTTLAGVIDPDYTGNIGVVLHNIGDTAKTIHRGDRIAQLIPEKADLPEIVIVDKLGNTDRGSNGFGSTEMKEKLMSPTQPVEPVILPVSTPMRQAAAAAAKFSLPPEPNPLPPVNDSESPSPSPPPADIDVDGCILNKCASDLHFAFTMPYDINLSPSPFDHHTTRTIDTWGSDPMLGFDIVMDSKLGLPQLKNINKSTPAARIKCWKSQLRGSFITSVNDKPVSTVAEIIQAFQPYVNNETSSELTIGFATVERLAMNPQLGLPQLYHDQMNVIARHLWDISNDAEWSERVNNAIPILETTNRDDCILTKEDRATLIHSGFPVRIKSVKSQRKLSRRILKQRDDWDDWQQSEWKQLDQYKDQDMFGDPEPMPRGVNLLNLLWCYLIKDCGRKKARCVCNGSKNMRGTVTLAETYAASLDQTASRIFWAATAINNFVTIGADAANAFAEAPPPVAPLYVFVDEQYREWHQARNKGADRIPNSYVMRAKRALQGHPESPRLWAKLIDKIIKKLNLKACTHEPNLYYTSNYKGTTDKKVLFLRQVDDFAISCQDEELCEQVISDINSEMTIDITKLGMISRFNGVDVEQTRHYIKLYNSTYIKKILKNHSWIHTEHPSALFPMPMRTDTEYQRNLETAKPLSDQERLKLEKLYGFTYRQGVGEILYALVTCRPDISYSTIKLSQFSTAPAKIHFDALKDVFRYLKATADDGIYYWRSSPRMDLPIGTIPVCKSDENYVDNVETRQQHHPDILHAAVDSDFAGDVSHRKSVTGIVIKLAGGAVLYKTSYQPTVAGSSTEAEFAAAAMAAKFILHLRTLLQEIGLRQEAATILYEDNQGALLMANAQRPTKRTRHMDIKHFTIQQWVAEDLLCLKRIDTVDNHSDAMTKALGRTLFYRHFNYIMGRVLPDYMKDMLQLRINRFSDRTFDNLLSRVGMKRRSLIPIQ